MRLVIESLTSKTWPYLFFFLLWLKKRKRRTISFQKGYQPNPEEKIKVLCSNKKLFSFFNFNFLAFSVRKIRKLVEYKNNSLKK
jgi:hypothetical protein